MVRIPTNLTRFDETEAHYVNYRFYDECAKDKAIAISRPIGMPLPEWKEIEDLSNDDLRQKLEEIKKQKMEKEKLHRRTSPRPKSRSTRKAFSLEGV